MLCFACRAVLGCPNRSVALSNVRILSVAMRRQPDRQTGYTLLELLYVVSIVCILLAILVPQLLVQRSRIVELQAQRRLRTIGSVMTDYSLSHHDRSYADLEELKDADLISRNITLTNIIVDYSLAITTTDRPDIGEPARYTIIAYPRPERSHDRLSTFAITEDNVVRVYRPGSDVSPGDPHTWDPVL